MKKIQLRALLMALSITMIVCGLMFYALEIKYTKKSPEMKVFVASRNISANTIISMEDIAEVTLPENVIVQGYIQDSRSVVGKIARENIYKGEMILQMNLVQGADQDGLAAIIPEGYRAVTASIDMVSGVGGNIKDGDFVDILVFLDKPYSENGEVLTVFQNVKVLSAQSQGDSRYITLVMTHDDAQKFFLINETGKIRFVLRNRADRTIEERTSVNMEAVN